MKNAYAIEYDCINPIQLSSSLEFKNIKGLFSAGQSNGSSGYEEAAAQGIIAGINAAMKIKGRKPLVKALIWLARAAFSTIAVSLSAQVFR